MSDPTLIPIIEAAARALMIADVHLTQANAERVAIAFTPIIEAAVTPLIEAKTLERAAKVADDQAGYAGHAAGAFASEYIAAAIRALKEQP